MDCKVVSPWRLWLRLSRPSSVIFSHLWESQKTDLTKIIYFSNLRLMDFKELIPSRPSPSYFRLSPVIPLHHWKLKLINCKVLSLLRSWLRVFRPSSVTSGILFSSQKNYFTKVAYAAKLRLRDCKARRFWRPSLRLFRLWSVICWHLLTCQ